MEKKTLRKLEYRELVLTFEDGKRFVVQNVPVYANSTDKELAQAAMNAFAKRIQDDPLNAAKQLAVNIYLAE